MNRFLTFTGVQPVFLGDVDFMQDAAANGFKQLARALMGSGDEAMNAILQGVKITSAAGNLYSWTAGVVVLNGELLPIAAGSVNAIDRDHLYFHVVSTLSGERTFEDQETHE